MPGSAHFPAMSDAERYLAYATECEPTALRCVFKADRQTFLEMAAHWRRLAAQCPVSAHDMPSPGGRAAADRRVRGDEEA